MWVGEDSNHTNVTVNQKDTAPTPLPHSRPPSPPTETIQRLVKRHELERFYLPVAIVGHKRGRQLQIKHL